VSTLNLGVYRVARQAMLPEDRLFERLEVRFIPNVGAQFAPALAPRMEVGLIYCESLWIGLRDELRLTWYRVYMGRVDRLAKTHVVISTNRVAIWFVIDVVSDFEVHATANILYYQTIAA
jgi:hypothetical protein